MAADAIALYSSADDEDENEDENEDATGTPPSALNHALVAVACWQFCSCGGGGDGGWSVSS